MTLPSFSSLAFVSVTVAVLAALAGRLAVRRRLAWWPAVAAAALMAGWAVLAGPPRGWWSPRLVVEHLPGAALAVAAGSAAAVRLRGRLQGWAGFVASGVAAWWMAGAPAGRPEFWRVWFAAMALGWVLRRVGAGAGAPALAFSATLAAGLVAAGAPAAETMAAYVLCGVAVTALRDAAGLPVMALSIALVGTELGAGRLVRGGVGMVELVCVAAVLAAALRDRAGRSLQRRIGRMAEIAAPVALAVVGTGFAWIGARAIRG